ncbi:Predicted dehydrogenase [Paramicrobacterium humi]|uniref:Predicted dehydrogenase n=1 Tax=Paramicrobacterium humi TaxID=640635 RepID=A0A1H4L8Z7_9MICO|nr:Gfo/Idh/MocA family oxidoreductase [Microbacterium humi]SEB66805.1 Predicted dehydrogenase [Microbacterium humi]
MRIGLIGAGAVAVNHVTAAEQIDGLGIAAVCDLNEDAARAVAPEDAAIFGDYRDLYASGLVDAVIVNTPHALHAPMAVEAAAAGLHALVEKPMATTLEDCDRMLRASEQHGTTLMVGHVQHYTPGKRAAADAIARGDIGAPLLLRDYRTTDYRPGIRTPWFFSRRIAGGGSLINIGGHCIDRTLWLAGGRARTVTASVARRHDVSVETDGIVRLELDTGATVSITVVSDAPRYADELVIVGEGGVITADPLNGTFRQQDGHTLTLWEANDDWLQDAFTAELRDFASAVGGAEPSVSLAHARHVVEVVLAAYESAQSGRPVSVR